VRQGDRTMTRDIYVVLTNTGTSFSKCIGLFTGEPLNHASVAFDDGLKDIYSFGRKHPMNAFSGGFVREKVWGDLIRDRRRATPSAIYRCSVEAETFRRMRKQVQRMSEDPTRYGYNLAGLFTLLAGIDWQRENTYFCSQFVEHLFATHGVALSGKPASLTKPGDFERSVRLESVFRGDLRAYAGEQHHAASSAAMLAIAAHKPA
jgi:hypothetical protein